MASIGSGGEDETGFLTIIVPSSDPKKVLVSEMI